MLAVARADRSSEGKGQEQRTHNKSTSMSAAESDSSKPQFITSLGDAYLQGVVLAGELQAAAKPAAPPAAAPAAALAAAPAPSSEASRVFCRVSDIWLENATALREHLKTDWYRYNLQRSTRGLPPVTETAFDELVENDALGDELSGSDSEGEDEDEATNGSSAAARPDGRVALRDSTGAVFLAWRAALLPAGAAAADVPLADLPQCLRALAALRPRPVWVVILCRGDHFAAAVLELQEPPKNSKRAEDAVKVLAHKTFHRYVTRRKQGGRQSAADGAKSIKSAGSSIRRHNEAMLNKEIRELLHAWSPTHLRLAQMIWVAAPGPANAAVLYAGADAPLDRVSFDRVSSSSDRVSSSPDRVSPLAVFGRCGRAARPEGWAGAHDPVSDRAPHACGDDAHGAASQPRRVLE